MLNLIFDTNIFLHCTAFDQLNACEYFNVKSATLNVPQVVIKELDRHKVNNDSRRIKKQAKQALGLLSKYNATNSITKNNLRIVKNPRKPKIRWGIYDLDQGEPDHRLIAAAIECKQSDSRKLVVVSRDSVVRIICETLEIECIEPPDKWLLQPEPDALEKENEKLRNELKKHQAKLPKFLVGFHGESSYKKAFVVKMPKPISEQAQAIKLKELEDLYPLKDPFQEAKPRKESLDQNTYNFVFDPMRHIPDEEISRYNRDRVDYFNKYRIYLASRKRQEERDSLSLEFTIEISNAGSYPADDVEIEMHFPDGFSLIESEDDDFIQIKKPQPPDELRTRGEIINSGLSVFSRAREDLLTSTVQRNIVSSTHTQSTFGLKKTNSYEFKGKYSSIMHGKSKVMPSLRLQFKSFELAKSFHCNYHICCRDLPEGIVGKLHFIINGNSIK